jgi:hypothetical protein
MRLSTQKKIDLEENQFRAIKLTDQQRDKNRKQRNKNKAVVLSLATDNKKPVNRKKNRNLRRVKGAWLNLPVYSNVPRPHGKHPEYIGLRKWPVK